MRRSPRRILPVLVLTSAALLLAGCDAALPSGTPAPTNPVNPGAESAAPTAPAPEAPEPADIDPETVTCETMLATDTLEELTDSGWTVREDPFVILDLELADGTQCTWGDFSSPTNDDLVLFGWAPIAADESGSAQEALLAEGWIEEQEDGKTFVTEDPEFALRTDADGYGVTYEFGDGFVAVSDTKQGLELITLSGL